MSGRPTITPAERQRLIALLGMLGSDRPGERDNAAKLAETFRRRYGVTWAELLNLQAAPEPPRQPPPPPRPQPKARPAAPPEEPTPPHRHAPAPFAATGQTAGWSASRACEGALRATVRD